MYVKVLHIDLVEGSMGYEVKEMASPSWTDIETAIKRLDGESRTQVAIGADGEMHLSVGGGEKGQYVVYATFDNMKFYTLLSDQPSETEVELVAGGQVGNYSGKIVVGLAPALMAAKTFAESGEIDRRLNWQEEGQV